MRKLLILIWIIDILNIGIPPLGFDLVEFLDVTVPINEAFWFLAFLFML